MTRILLALLSASPLLASPPPDPAAALDSMGRHLLNEDLPEGTFGRSAAADLDGDLVPDLTFVHGGLLYYCPDPALFGVWMTVKDGSLPIAANDVVAWPAVEPGEGDRVLAVGPNGLHSVGRANGAWVIDKLGTELWEGVTRLSLLESEQGRTEIVGVTAGGTSLARLTVEGTQTTEAEILLTAIVNEAILLDVTGDDTLEVALASDVGFAVIDQTGALVYGYPTPCTGMAPFDAGNGLTGVVWTSRLENEQEAWDFLMVDYLGATVDAAGYPLTAQPLGDFDVASVTTADMNGDSLVDLVLTTRHAPHVFTVFNDGGTGVMGPGGTWTVNPFFHVGEGLELDVLDEETETPGPAFEPTIGDFDSDGVADIVIANDDRDQQLYYSLGSEDGEWFFDLEDIAYGVSESDPKEYLFFPVRNFDPPAVPAGSTLHIEVVVWRREPSGVTIPTPVWRYEEPAMQSPGLGNGDHAVAYGIPAHEMFGAHFFLFRYVAIDDVTGEYAQVFASRVLGMTTQLAGITHTAVHPELPTQAARQMTTWTTGGVSFAHLELPESILDHPPVCPECVLADPWDTPIINDVTPIPGTGNTPPPTTR